MTEHHLFRPRRRLTIPALLALLLAALPVAAQSPSVEFSETFDPVVYDEAQAAPPADAETEAPTGAAAEEPEIIQRVVNEGGTSTIPAPDAPAPAADTGAGRGAGTAAGEPLEYPTPAESAPLAGEEAVPVESGEAPTASPTETVTALPEEPASNIGLSAEAILAAPPPEPEPVPESQSAATPAAAPQPAEPAVPVDRALVFSVRDMGVAIDAWQRLFGVGPWKIADFDVMEPQGGRLRLARANMGSTRLELVQALNLDQQTAFYARLDIRGLIAFTPSTSTDVMVLAQRYQPIIKSQVGVLLASWEELGVNLWIPGEDPQFWGASTPVTNPVVDLSGATAHKLGIVVPEHRRLANQWLEILGIQPWELIHAGPEQFTNMHYLGFRSGAENPLKLKLAVAKTSTLQIELIEAVDGTSPYRDFSYKESLGVQYWGITPTLDHDDIVQRLQQAGVAVQMQADIGGEGRTVTHLDLGEELGFVLEVAREVQGESRMRPFAIFPSPYQ